MWCCSVSGSGREPSEHCSKRKNPAVGDRSKRHRRFPPDSSGRKKTTRSPVSRHPGWIVAVDNVPVD